MADGIFLAGAGMIARQVRHDALANNFANVSTPGYKASRVFAKVLQDVGGSAEALRDVERSQELYTDFSQGPLERTDRSLDFALQGDGFFAVQTPQGERYTRNGSFTLNGDGDLVTSSGMLVLGEGGALTIKGAELSVNAEGEIFDGQRLIGKLMLKNFSSTESLRREGMSLFGPPEGESLEEVAATPKVNQGFLEGSNAKGIEEMVRMMSMMKHYEASQRVLKLQSQTLGRAVNEIVRG